MIAELLDGALVLTPPPGFGHQEAVLNLAGALRQACPPGLRVVITPFVVRLGEQTELRPDVLVARYADLTRDELTAPPLLAAEVRSPGTGLLDRSMKKAVYARHGVPVYWLVDPETPSLTAFELAGDGEYAVAAYVAGPQQYLASRPFPVALVPVELVAGLRPG